MEEAETRTVASWGLVRNEDGSGNQAEWAAVRRHWFLDVS